MQHPALKVVEDVCRDFDGNGIYSVGASGALRAMAHHWKDHLAEGRGPKLISQDIEEMVRQLEVMRAEIMNRLLGDGAQSGGCGNCSACSCAAESETVAPTLEQLIQLIKDDTVRLMGAGTIPRTVASFSELHNYCDANCLGGLCNDKIVAALVKQHGGRDLIGGMPQGMLDMINAAQDEVDKWLAEMNAGTDLARIDLTKKAPLTREQLQQLQRDSQDIRATATRKQVTLDAWEERSESIAAKAHFDLGCWLYHYTTLRGLTPAEHMRARVNVLVRLFMNDIQNPRYRFYTVFDFGERQFDGMFEEGDSSELIAELRKYLANDETGRMSKAFDCFGWPKEV